MKAWVTDGRMILMGESLSEHAAIRAFVGQTVEQGEIAIPGVGTSGGCFIRLPQMSNPDAPAPTIRTGMDVELLR